MKIKICFLTALLCMSSLLPCQTSASAFDPLVSPDAGKDIESNILEDDKSSYAFLFETSDINIMFDYAIPYYTYNFERTYTCLQDLYNFTGYYIVPVTSGSGKFIAFAEYSKRKDNKWQIISTSTGEYYSSLYKMIMSSDIFSGYSSAFLTGDLWINELGIVLQNDSTVYFDYSSYFSDSSSGDYRTQLSPSSYFVSEDEKAAELVLTPITDPDTDIGYLGYGDAFDAEDDQYIDVDEPVDPTEEGSIQYDWPVDDDDTDEQDISDYKQTLEDEDDLPDEGVHYDTETSSPNTGNTPSAIAAASLCGALCLGLLSRKKK